MAIANRIEKLRSALKEQGIQGMLVMSPENRYYLSGFSGSNAYLLITADKAQLITDFRYIEQAKKECPDYEIIRYYKTDLFAVLQTSLSAQGITTLGFEQDYITYDFYVNMRKSLDVELTPTLGLVEAIRMIKDSTEIEIMQQAQDIAEDAFKAILPLIKPGIEERLLAAELEYQMRKLGAERVAFATIIASGERSALPHGRASAKIVQAGEFITFDFGAYYNGYCSDMTRTVAVGNVNDEQRKVYATVLKAQLAALEACQPGATGLAVDKVARDVITAAGYGEYFGHGLGHGVGKAVHEGPRLSVQSKDVLKPGHVVTVEPGIYLPGWGGVRIEDMIVITADGYRNFNKSSKELLIL